MYATQLMSASSKTAITFDHVPYANGAMFFAKEGDKAKQFVLDCFISADRDFNHYKDNVTYPLKMQVTSYAKAGTPVIIRSVVQESFRKLLGEQRKLKVAYDKLVPLSDVKVPVKYVVDGYDDMITATLHVPVHKNGPTKDMIDCEIKLDGEAKQMSRFDLHSTLVGKQYVARVTCDFAAFVKDNHVWIQMRVKKLTAVNRTPKAEEAEESPEDQAKKAALDDDFMKMLTTSE